jgi:hypothetical protein
MARCVSVDGPGAVATHVEFDGVFADVQVRAGLLELGQHRVQRVGRVW